MITALILLGLGLLAVIWYTGIGQDTVKYRDGWKTKALFNDKAVHFVIGMGLQAHLSLVVGEVWSLVYILINAVIYEIVTHWPREKGLVKLTMKEAFDTAWRDVVACVIGAICSIIWFQIAQVYA